jgi:polyisoprenoid-binding protein YceI
MNKLLAVAALAVLTVGPSISAAEWDVDPVHSNVGFSVSHLVIATVTGKYTTFSGKVDWDGQNLAGASVEMSIDAASISTDNTQRDTHLKSPDFFDVEKYPTLTFKSKKVIPGAGKDFKLVGDLTLRGVTKEVTFDCVFKGVVEFMGTTKAGFTAKTTINRMDFGVSWSKTLDNGGLVVGNDVEITLQLELSKKAQ